MWTNEGRLDGCGAAANSRRQVRTATCATERRFEFTAADSPGASLPISPDAEAKLVWRPRRALFDVAVDLRRTSATYREWFGIELAAGTGRQLYVPEGCAHGYLTLGDDTELAHGTTCFYEPDATAGLGYDDPALGGEWPHSAELGGESDRSWPLLGGTVA